MSKHEYSHDESETTGKFALKLTIAFVVGSLLLLSSGYASAAVIFSDVDGVRSKWGEQTLGTGTDVTWSVMDTGTSCWVFGSDCQFTAFEDFLPTGWNSVLNTAFSAWSDVANVNFIQVEDAGEAFNAGGESGKIRLGGRNIDGERGILARGWFPIQDGAPLGGDIHLDTSELWSLNGESDGFNLLHVLTHEIGHAIGLTSSFDVDSVLYPWYRSNRTPGLADSDVATAQLLYGAREPVFAQANVNDEATAVNAPATIGLFILSITIVGLRRSKQTRAA